MAHRIRPHSERSRRTHDAGSKIASLFAQDIEIAPILGMCACPSAKAGTQGRVTCGCPGSPAFAGTTKQRIGLKRSRPGAKRPPIFFVPFVLFVVKALLLL